ncbi:MAG TPA: tetratricopeptide repeat protein [Blastocatellia bacterium]|nr:tetratricopeptide repeat protein [Blastocatellia bacterium]
MDESRDPWCKAGSYGFIGRDDDLLRVKQSLADDQFPWVLIQGIGGMGKTQLAFAFARQLAETGACPGGVRVTSFQAFADFGRVLGSLRGVGGDFSSLPEKDQWDRSVQYLKRTPSLLIWDNLETVAGYPGSSGGLASEVVRQKLSKFLKALRGGKSRIVITTRRAEEGWLDIPYRSLTITGLSQSDARRLGDAVVESIEIAAEYVHADPDYPRLLEMLKGHPRSIEIVIRQLRERTPRQIIDWFSEHTKSDEEIGDLSFRFVFSRLTEEARLHLPLLGLFAASVDAETLGSFVRSANQRNQTYTRLMGAALSTVDWERVLGEAARNGLIQSVGKRAYELHPVLSTQLRTELFSTVQAGGLAELDGELYRLYSSKASRQGPQLKKGDQESLVRFSLEEANFRHALRNAVALDQWTDARNIATALICFYRATDRIDEHRGLRDDLIDRLGRKGRSKPDEAKMKFRAVLTGDKANDALARGDLEMAEQGFTWIAHYLLSLKNSQVEPQVAAVYDQLGVVAERRLQYETAEHRFKKALAIRERLWLEREAAADYHHLGRVTMLRGQFDQAEDWFRKAAAAFEQLGLEEAVAMCCHELGSIVIERDQYDEAEQLHDRALKIYLRLGLEPQTAASYNMLARVAQHRCRFDLAESQIGESIEIYERRGAEDAVAMSYAQLSSIAEACYQFERAEELARKSLEIFERLGLESEIANSYKQLGSVIEETGQRDEAGQWYRKALEIFDRLGEEREAASIYNSLGRLALYGNEYDQAEEWHRKSLRILERAGSERETARVWHGLGLIAQRREDYRQATEWYRKALAVQERSGFHEDAAKVCHQLGKIARSQQRYDEAERLLKRALEIDEWRAYPPRKVDTLAVLGLLNQDQGRYDEAISYLGLAFRITVEFKMPASAGVDKDLRGLAEAMGEDNFKVAWRAAFDGEEPPEGIIKPPADEGRN